VSGMYRGLVSVAALELAGPLAIFYGLRAVGVSQWIALLTAGALPAARAVHDLVVERRVSGVSAKTFSQPAAFSASVCPSRFCDPLAGERVHKKAHSLDHVPKPGSVTAFLQR
jgi:hypothetical protein